MPDRPIDAYLSTVQALWPDAPEPRLHRGRGSGASAIQLRVLPRAEAPRLLVPVDNRAAAARAMLRFSSALAAGDTVRRLGVAAALRGGVDRAFPDRIEVQDVPGSLREHLSGLLRQPVDVSIGIGTARANRKPVLQVFDSRGRSLAFVKVGETPLTRSLVTAEAEALRRLEGSGVPTVLALPRLLHLSEWEGATVLTMSALSTTCRQRPSRQHELPRAQMQALHDAFATPARPLVESPLWQRLVADVGAVADPSTRERLARLLDQVAAAAGPEPLPLGAWHGDWTPWNQSRRRGRLQVWDWERFETGVPAGLDRCHYAVNTVVRRDGLSAASVRRGIEHAGLSGDRTVVAAYLLTVLVRYHLDAEGEPGAHVQARAETLGEVLESWLEQGAEARHG